MRGNDKSLGESLGFDEGLSVGESLGFDEGLAAGVSVGFDQSLINFQINQDSKKTYSSSPPTSITATALVGRRHHINNDNGKRLRIDKEET
jgi:hypothetical protein